MDVDQIKAKFIASIDDFCSSTDSSLVLTEVSERAIAHKFAERLQKEFPESNVDCEYNRNLGEPKRIRFKLKDALESEVKRLATRAKQLKELLDDKNKDGINLDEFEIFFSTFPDIIVHTRRENAPSNLLVIEIKKEEADGQAIEFDKAKLRAFTEAEDNPYEYKVGVHLTLQNVGGKVTYSYQYFQHGDEDGDVTAATEHTEHAQAVPAQDRKNEAKRN